MIEGVELVQEKKGGPYSKNEREKRQKEVARLYFEFGYSAVKIADLMKINRNTINADIKYWYSNIKEKLKQDSGDFVLRQIGRFEAQRSRIIERITEKKIDNTIYEKLLFDIDTKIINIVLRINSDKIISNPIKIQEDLIKDIILFLLIKHNSNYSLEREEIISEIVNMQQCTIIEANEIFSQMEMLGFECCRKNDRSWSGYNLLEFAYLRRYVWLNDEFVYAINLIYVLHLQTKTEKTTLDEKYGNKKEWTEKTFEKYDKEKNKVIEKYEQTINEIIAKALEKLSNQERAKKYREYIRVFFYKKERDRVKEFLE